MGKTLFYSTYSCSRLLKLLVTVFENSYELPFADTKFAADGFNSPHF